MTGALRSTATLASLPRIDVPGGMRPGMVRNAPAWIIATAWLAVLGRDPIRVGAFPVHVVREGQEAVEIQLNLGLANFLVSVADARAFGPEIIASIPADVSATALIRLLSNVADDAEGIAQGGGL